MECQVNVLTLPTAVNDYVCGSTLSYDEPHQYSITWLSHCIKKYIWISQLSQLLDKRSLSIFKPTSVIMLSALTVMSSMIQFQITDAGVCHFMENAACCPNLVYISFSGTNITDHSLQAMRGGFRDSWFLKIKEILRDFTQFRYTLTL